MRQIAFLRAINVGGHTVKMGTLRELIESCGFSAVETFIASGNVIFDTTLADPAEVEAMIEARLEQALGYTVAVFIRSTEDLADIAAYQAFSDSETANTVALNIAFLKRPLDEASWEKLAGLKTAIDDFHVHGREIYWLCRKKQSESTFSNAVLEKALKVQATLRGVNTIRRMAAKYTASK